MIAYSTAPITTIHSMFRQKKKKKAWGWEEKKNNKIPALMWFD